MDVRSVTSLALTRVFILFLLCCSSQACSLEVWSGNTQLDTTDVCEMEYPTANCIDFLQSFNRSDLPYVEEGSDVQRPGSINIVGLSTEYAGSMYPSLSVRWDSPLSGNAREDCNGFLLSITPSGEQSNSTVCRIFKFNSSSEIRKEELNYRFIIPYAFGNSDYDIRVYSMPPPPPEHRDRPEAFVKMSARTSSPYVIGGNPSSWAPIVSYQTRSNGTIDVKFSLSPPNFNFTLFEVNLLDSPASTIRSENYSGEVFSDAHPQGIVRFDNIPSGQYQIVVWVKDRFKDIPGQCQCWENETNGKHCTNICGFTTTAWFQLNVTELPRPPTGTSPDPSKSPDSSSEPVETNPTTPDPLPLPSPSRSSSPQDNTATIVGIVVACIVVIAAIILVFAICKRRDSPQVKRLVKVVRSLPWKKGPRDTVWTLPQPTSQPSHLPMKKSLDLAYETLYLMSADDHEAHTKCVECLVEFLREHCHCNVIYAPWDYKQDRGIYEWFQASMSRTSRIMFIDSVAAFKLTQAHLNQKTYRPRKGKPGDELFKIGLKHLLSDQAGEARANAVIVSFGGIRCQTIIQAPHSYEVPGDLPLLLCKIHNIDMKDRKEYSSCLPMLVENISWLEKGANLLSSIKDLITFEANNPGCFEETFGEPKTILQQLTSILSNDSGFQSLRHYPHRSVSQQDLSDAGSPSSNLSQPMFTPPVCHENMPPWSGSSGPMALPFQHNPYVDTLMPSHQNYGKYQHENDPLDGFSAVTLDTNALNDRARLGPSTSYEQPEPSVFTIVSEQMNQSEANSRFKGEKLPDGISIIPPESVCGIDSYSNALRQFTSYDDRSSYHNPQSEHIPEAGWAYQNPAMTAEEFQRHIQPPDSLSDIQADSISSALAAFNADFGYPMEGSLALTEDTKAASENDCSCI